MRRVALIGSAGAGKTTLARTLAACLAVPHIEMDALRWGPGWHDVDRATLMARLAGACAAAPAGWVADGNYVGGPYEALRAALWADVDVVVWLDYPLPLVLTRLWCRTWRRVAGRERLWHGNRESLWRQFCSRRSIFRSAWENHRYLRATVPALIASPGAPLLVRLTSPAATARFLAACGTGRAAPSSAR